MILIAMMLLVMLTVMGITSTSTSIVENRIAVNEQLHKMAFYNAEAGIQATARLTRAVNLADLYGVSVSDDAFGFKYLDEDDGAAFIEDSIFSGEADDNDNGNDLDRFKAHIEIPLQNGRIVTRAQNLDTIEQVEDGGLAGAHGKMEYRVRFSSKGESHRNASSIVVADYHFEIPIGIN